MEDLLLSNLCVGPVLARLDRVTEVIAAAEAVAVVEDGVPVPYSAGPIPS